GGHTAHRERAALVARLDQQLGIGAHERDSHGHLNAIGEDELGAAVEFLDDAEDVVPAPGVESGGVVAQLVEDLVHLESGCDDLEQYGCLDRAAGDAERVLGEVEDLVPEARFAVAFELGQVEIWSAAVAE